ncbi:MAG: glycosyltransferase [Candidatus Micrarchaeia archaeon]
MAAPKVSIIIPSRNKASVILETLECVVAQTEKDFEAFVIDNNSKDGTREIVKKFIAKDKRFELTENNGDEGLVYSLNLGISKARGRYIAVLHCDDVWQDNFLESSIALFEKNPSSGICFCRCENIDERSKLHRIAARNEYSGESRLIGSQELFERYVKRDFTPVCTVLVRKEVHEKCGKYDPQYPGPSDYQMWIKIAHKFDGVFNGGSTSKYRIYGENDSNTMIDENAILIEQYSMILKLFREYVEKTSERQRFKRVLLRNTALSSLRQAVNAIAQNKGTVARTKCGFAIMCYGGINETIIAGVIYFASLFTIILAPIISFLIPHILKIMKKSGHY